MQRTDFHKQEISDLRELALAVHRQEALVRGLSARQAALCLSGVASLVAGRTSPALMQRACGELARYAPAWATKLGDLPAGHDGRVDDGVRMLAIAARGILELAGVDNTRAAVAFWASERDPAIWQSLAE